MEVFRRATQVTEITAKSAVRAHKILENIASSSVFEHRDLVLARFPRCFNADNPSGGEAETSADAAVASAEAAVAAETSKE